MLNDADAGAWRLALNNLSFLLENEPANADALLLQRNWQEALLGLLGRPQVAVLSCRNSDRFLEIVGDAATAFNFKMLVNVFAMVIMRHLWTKRDGTRALLRQTLDNIEKAFGAGDVEAIGLIRVLLYVFCNRLRHYPIPQFQANPVALPNAIKLIEIVEQFVFYSGGQTKYAVEHHDIALHIALDGKASSDKDLLDAAVQLCEFVHRHVSPATAESRTMLGAVHAYLALFSDAACLCAAHADPIVLAPALHLLKKMYLKGGVGQKHKRPAARARNDDYELGKALRYRLAEEIEARAVGALTKPSPAASAVCADEAATTIAPRSGSRRMTFFIDNYASATAAMGAAERCSGRVRPVFRMETDCLRTKKGEADNMLSAAKGSLVCILSPNLGAKIVLGSCCNRIGFVVRSNLSLTPVAYETETPFGKGLRVAGASPRKLLATMASADSIISPTKGGGGDDDDGKRRLSVFLATTDNDSSSFDHDNTLFSESVHSFEILPIPERDVLQAETSTTTTKPATSPDSSILKSMESLPGDSIQLGSVSARGSRESIDFSMDLVAEINSMKSGLQSLISPRNADQDAAAADRRASVAFAMHIQHERCETIDLQALLALAEMGIALPAEIHAEPVLIEAAARQAAACYDCGRALSTDPHLFDGRPVCAQDYVKNRVHCWICGHELGDVAGTRRLSPGSRVHIACAHCSGPSCPPCRHCPFTESADGVAEVEWQGLLYCRRDFAALFWRTCAQCHRVAVGDFVGVAGRAYHPPCLVCSVCAVVLGDDAAAGLPVTLPDTPELFCQEHARLHQLDRQCAMCQQVIREDGDRATSIRIEPYRFHRACAACAICGGTPESAADQGYRVTSEEPMAVVCGRHVTDQNRPQCPQCAKPIDAADGVLVGALSYHQACLRCSVCDASLAHRTIYSLNGKLVCRTDYQAEKKEGKKGICEACGLEIRSSKQGVKIKGRKLHQACVRCSVCHEQLGGVGQVVYLHQRRLLCSLHYDQALAVPNH